MSHIFGEIIQKTLFLTFQYDLLDLCDVVAGEGAEDTGALWRAHVPAVVTLLHHKDDVAWVSHAHFRY